MRMKTTIGLYGKGNEIISWHLLCVGSCFVFSDNCHYMCCRWNTLHKIWMSWIDNENVCQGSKTIFSDDNIHLILCVVKEKVKNLSLYVGFTVQCNSYNNISKHIMGCSALTPTWAMDTQIIDGMITLASWKMHNYRMWYIETNTKCYKKMGGG
jgi:hypothetical protein